MNEQDTETIIDCELCGLAHRLGAVACDRCDHALGTEPDWEALRDELPALKWKMGLGLVSLFALIALNLLVFQGAGFIILLAPIGWIVLSGYRHVVLAEQLRRARQANPED